MTNTPHESGGSDDAEEPRTSADEARTDAAIQDFNARVQWPRRPADPHDPAMPPPHADPIPQRPPPSRGLTDGWRTVGIGALGLLGGTLFGIIVQDILALIFINTGTTVFGLVFALVIPVFAVLGVVVAVLLDNRMVRRRSGGRR
ncbi:MAG TPA: hypothetical protein VIG71_05955 [Enteractinococcus sp.]